MVRSSLILNKIYMNIQFRVFLTALLALSFGFASYAQDEVKPKFMEKVADTLVRFYYDENYYLVDKDCEFKAIERVSKLNIQNKTFDGPFKDFGTNGHTILEGNYKNGSKEGKFYAYHSNGKLKWETIYENNELKDYWKYYYPNGKPMLFLKIDSGQILFDNFWDAEGNQKITNGTGDKYDITLPIIGFTEHGFTQFRKLGAVLNGKMHGTWLTLFISPNRTNIQNVLFKEKFSEGTLVDFKINEEFANYGLESLDFEFVPTSHFTRAEEFFGKDCSFDQHTDFHLAIAKQITRRLSYYSLKDINIERIPVSYKVRVFKTGKPNTPYALTLPKSLKTNTETSIKSAVTLPYYLPSYSNGEAISDIVEVSFEIEKVENKWVVNFVNIKREKGH